MGRFAVNILVTVGTTPYDELIEAVDTGQHASNARLQIANGTYIPLVAQWDRFIDDFQIRCAEADVVVCHAGAGSVFGLLQSGVCPVVVPNLARRDVHQAELARWLERKRFAPIAWQLDDVNLLIAKHTEFAADCRSFDVERFFLDDELNDELRLAISK